MAELEVTKVDSVEQALIDASVNVTKKGPTDEEKEQYKKEL